MRSETSVHGLLALCLLLSGRAEHGTRDGRQRLGKQLGTSRAKDTPYFLRAWLLWPASSNQLPAPCFLVFPNNSNVS